MVATIKQMSGTETYIPREAYKIPNQEPGTHGITPGGCGVWWNPSNLFDGVEDNDAVSRYQFHQLTLANNPDDGLELMHANIDNSQRSPGLDVTFTADKSISGLWALLPAQKRFQVELSIRDAVRAALEVTILKYCSYASLTVPGEVSIFVPGKLIGAVFPRHKDLWGNPHLHTRCVLFNAVLCHHHLGEYEIKERQELWGWVQANKHYTFVDYWPEPLQWGLWGSLAVNAIHQWVEAAGAAFRCSLAWDLQERLGVVMEQYGPDDQFTRIAGMPQDIIDHWSEPARSDDAEGPPNKVEKSPDRLPPLPF